MVQPKFAWLVNPPPGRTLVLQSGVGRRRFQAELVGQFVTDGLPFSRLREKALINEAAADAQDALDFSQRIRAGRPGFSNPGS